MTLLLARVFRHTREQRAAMREMQKEEEAKKVIDLVKVNNKYCRSCLVAGLYS